MKFVCDRCQTKYAIADERVRGKILKVKCKTCANVMTVREGRRPSTGPIPTVPAQEAESERTVLAPHPGLFAEPSKPHVPPPPPVAHPPLRKTGSIPAVAPDDGVAWYMALSGERSGPFSRKQLVDKVAALPKNADLHVWNEELGAWKPPSDVPAIAADLATRRRAPPPPPGAPRGLPHPPPPPPLGSAAHVSHPSLGHVPLGAPAHAGAAQAAHASSPHIERPARSASGPIVAPLGPGVGLKLPPPSGGGHARASASPSGAHPTHQPAHPPDLGVDIDPSTMLETPAPQPHMHPGLRRTNGVKSASAHPPASATRSSSDVLNLLNLPGAAAAASGAAGASHGSGSPRLMSSAAAVGWSPDVEAPAARSRNAKMLVILMAVIGIVIIVLAFGAMKRRSPPPPVESTAQVTDPLAGVVAKMNEKPVEPPPPPVVAPVPPPPPVQTGRGGKRGRPAKGAKVAAAPPTTVAPPVVAPNADAARFQDKSGPAVKVIPAQAPSRPPPSQGQITAVINNNRNGIKTCYQRALARDNSLTRGKMTVGLTIGISGRVKQTKVDGPNSFRLLLEPCIRELASRWVFPQASEEYGTEFPLVFQGNE